MKLDKLKEPEWVFITQIAIDQGEPGHCGDLFGVGSDGIVYEYLKEYHRWRPLNMEVHR
jgi:hypothetical protein